jgi:hypothetical protein
MDFLNAYLNYISVSNRTVASPVATGIPGARNDNDDSIEAVLAAAESVADQKANDSPCSVVTFDDFRQDAPNKQAGRIKETNEAQLGRENLTQIRKERKASERREGRYIRFIAPLVDDDSLTPVTLTPSKPKSVPPARERPSFKSENPRFHVGRSNTSSLESMPADLIIRSNEQASRQSDAARNTKASPSESSLSGSLKQVKSLFGFR